MNQLPNKRVALDCLRERCLPVERQRAVASEHNRSLRSALHVQRNFGMLGSQIRIRGSRLWPGVAAFLRWPREIL